VRAVLEGGAEGAVDVGGKGALGDLPNKRSREGITEEVRGEPIDLFPA